MQLSTIFFSSGPSVKPAVVWFQQKCLMNLPLF